MRQHAEVMTSFALVLTVPVLPFALGCVLCGSAWVGAGAAAVAAWAYDRLADRLSP